MKTFKEILIESIFEIEAILGKSLIKKPEIGKDEDEAKNNFMKSMKIQQKNGHIPKGNIKITKVKKLG